MRSFVFVVSLLMLNAWSVAGQETQPEPGTFQLVLIRHAEKLDAGRDPELSEAGRQRAAWTADWLQNNNIETIWSSDYKRTRDTAMPLAVRLGKGIKIYDPSNLPFLAAQLRSEKLNALIVGHSNSTPQLASLLCNCEVMPMTDSEYDRAILIGYKADLVEMMEVDQQTLRKSEKDRVY
jgi:phosphohistidine phosphatase SixA